MFTGSCVPWPENSGELKSASRRIRGAGTTKDWINYKPANEKIAAVSAKGGISAKEDG